MTSSAICPRCSTAITPTQVFCSSCGLKINSLTSATEIDAYVLARIEQNLDERTQDKDNIPSNLAQKADAILLERVKWYLLVGGLIGGLAVFFGIKSVQDVKQKMILSMAGVSRDITREKSQAQEEEQQIRRVEVSLDQLGKAVQSQADRVVQQSGDVSSKIAELEQEEVDVKQKINVQLNEAQSVAAKLQTVEAQLITTIPQVSVAADKESILQELPNLGQTQHVTYDMQPWKGPASKIPGQKWLSLLLFPLAQQRLTKEEITQLQEGLKNENVVTYLGVFGSKGAYPTNFYLSVGTAAVLYFNKSDAKTAEAIAGIASKALSEKVIAQYYSADSSMDPDDRLVIQKSGLDFQLSIP